MTSAPHHLSDCWKCKNFEKSASIRKVSLYLSEILAFRVKILMLSQQLEQLKKKKLLAQNNISRIKAFRTAIVGLIAFSSNLHFDSSSYSFAALFFDTISPFILALKKNNS